MAFGTASIAGYMSQGEVATLNYLFGTTTVDPSITDVSQLPPIYRIAGGSCIWGRYGRVKGSDTQTLPTLFSVKYYDEATGFLQETYGCIYHGFPWNIYGPIKRHDHLEGKKFLARHALHAVDMCHWNLERWGQPPGEYNRHEPYQERNRQGQPFPKGDDDILRHMDGFGLAQVLSDADIKALGGWSSDEAVAWADAMLDWLVKVPNISQIQANPNNNHIREYHRMGNPLNTLAGIHDVYKTYGYVEKAARTLDLSASFINLIYQDGWSLTYTGTGSDGTVTFQIWNYGDWIGGDVNRPAFKYTHYRFGSQPWYDGMNMQGLYHLGLRFLAANLGTQTAYTDTITMPTSLATAIEGDQTLVYEWATLSSALFTGASEGWDAAFQKCVQVIDKTTAWYDYTLREFCPLGDYASHGAQDFINCKLHGFKSADGSGTCISSETAYHLTPSDWNDLSEDTDYYRWFVLDIHESDGQYHSLLETDTNGLQYKRVHYPKRHIKFDDNGDAVSGYDTDDPYFLPRVEISNAYLVPDMMWMRAQIYNDDDMRDFARICMFDYMAYANKPSDRFVAKDERLDPDDGWTEASSYNLAFSRLWHWTMACGMEIRNDDLGLG